MSVSPTILRTAPKLGDYMAVSDKTKFRVQNKGTRPWIVNKVTDQAKYRKVAKQNKNKEEKSYTARTFESDQPSVTANNCTEILDSYHNKINDIQNDYNILNREINNVEKITSEEPFFKEGSRSPILARTNHHQTNDDEILNIISSTKHLNVNDNSDDTEEDKFKKAMLERDLEMEYQNQINMMYNNKHTNMMTSNWQMNQILNQNQNQLNQQFLASQHPPLLPFQPFYIVYPQHPVTSQSHLNEPLPVTSQPSMYDQPPVTSQMSFSHQLPVDSQTFMHDQPQLASTASGLHPVSSQTPMNYPQNCNYMHRDELIRESFSGYNNCNNQGGLYHNNGYSEGYTSNGYSDGSGSDGISDACSLSGFSDNCSMDGSTDGTSTSGYSDRGSLDGYLDGCSYSAGSSDDEDMVNNVNIPREYFADKLEDDIELNNLVLSIIDD